MGIRLGVRVPLFRKGQRPVDNGKLGKLQTESWMLNIGL